MLTTILSVIKRLFITLKTKQLQKQKQKHLLEILHLELTIFCSVGHWTKIPKNCLHQRNKIILKAVKQNQPILNNLNFWLLQNIDAQKGVGLGRVVREVR
jgi:hypothetical protein